MGNLHHMKTNTLASHRNRAFMRNADDGGGGGNPPADDAGTGGDDFAPITSQEEFDKRISRRLNSERAKYRDYDTLKSKAEQFDLLARESQTDREREIEEARLEAFNEAMSKAVPIAVKAEFKSAAKGVLTDEALQSLLEDLDLTRYATDDGDPDEDKIARKIAALAPAKGSRENRARTGFGQGRGRRARSARARQACWKHSGGSARRRPTARPDARDTT
jgi:hypothetical protein